MFDETIPPFYGQICLNELKSCNDLFRQNVKFLVAKWNKAQKVY